MGAVPADTYALATAVSVVAGKNEEPTALTLGPTQSALDDAFALAERKKVLTDLEECVLKLHSTGIVAEKTYQVTANVFNVRKVKVQVKHDLS